MHAIHVFETCFCYLLNAATLSGVASNHHVSFQQSIFVSHEKCFEGIHGQGGLNTRYLLTNSY